MKNLSLLGKGCVQYLNDSDNQMFSAKTEAENAWPQILQRKYVQGWQVYRSPFDTITTERPSRETGAIPISYGINEHLFDTSRTTWTSRDSELIFAAQAVVKNPGKTIEWQPDAYATANCKVSPTGGVGNFGTYHDRSMLNVLFADFHVEPVTCKRFTENTTPEGRERWLPQ
jgi:prepilin-type processing-associated H-X9-DG protein